MRLFLIFGYNRSCGDFLLTSKYIKHREASQKTSNSSGKIELDKNMLKANETKTSKVASNCF